MCLPIFFYLEDEEEEDATAQLDLQTARIKSLLDGEEAVCQCHVSITTGNIICTIMRTVRCIFV
jgi:hypothetical protein